MAAGVIPAVATCWWEAVGTRNRLDEAKRAGCGPCIATTMTAKTASPARQAASDEMRRM
jgi:hypothetical protein